MKKKRRLNWLCFVGVGHKTFSVGGLTPSSHRRTVNIEPNCGQNGPLGVTAINWGWGEATCASVPHPPAPPTQLYKSRKPLWLKDLTNQCWGRWVNSVNVETVPERPLWSAWKLSLDNFLCSDGKVEVFLPRWHWSEGGGLPGLPFHPPSLSLSLFLFLYLLCSSHCQSSCQLLSASFLPFIISTLDLISIWVAVCQFVYPPPLHIFFSWCSISSEC